MNTRIPNEPHKAVLLTAVGTTVVIAIGAFILSFAALTDLAQRSGIEAHLAWIWPIIVDGMIVASTVAIVALNGHSRRAMVYPWTLLFFGAIVSTAANSVHAILTVDAIRSGIPPIVSALVAAMPPVVLLAITHLTVHMYQKRAEAAELHREWAAQEEAEYYEAERERAALEEAYRAPEYRAPEHHAPEHRAPERHAPPAPPYAPPAPTSGPVTAALPMQAPAQAPAQAEDDVVPALYEEMVQALEPVDPAPAEGAGVSFSDEELSQEDLPDDDPRLSAAAKG
ncbi:DUF2637 domain-containing protein [Arthrobacter celericrescens]|uniref:DUF2637 domain-containing protein n=1 Tax=Arthrobacter celericrescens TaxID=2320851 RepID=UPI000EA404B1|nr:DUF2637 domain-containing protein [Arthrobacter celericrescens]